MPHLVADALRSPYIAHSVDLPERTKGHNISHNYRHGGASLDTMGKKTKLMHRT